LHALYRAEDVSVMGFVEVVPKLVGILRMLKGLASWAEVNRPDAAILIDSADLNLRLARQLHLCGVPTAAYVAPMAWAWRESRVRALRDLDRLLCIYPFEEAWFRSRGVDAVYVGNPLLEQEALRSLSDRDGCRRALGLSADGPVLALLPGSRRAEIIQLLPTLLDAADRLVATTPSLRVVLPVAPTLAPGLVESFVAGRRCRPLLVSGRSLEAMGAADAVALCSGTATLEAALLGRPMVVVYRAHPLSFRLAKLLVRLHHVAIVNLLSEDEVVPELLQDDLGPEALAAALAPLLADTDERARMLARLSSLRDLLGDRCASEAAAAEILAVADGRRLAVGASGDVERLRAG
ncbi:MAG TPA: lipid-A-disaccharide synthase, partial [Vulgatibacter sp.]|nr:lipid-A-disaccharide synthase [Vulgatibacter sp.]